MIKYTEHCDICEKEFKEDKNGFCVEVGYSIGGWGRRADFISNRQMEVCDSCLEKLKPKVMELKKALKD